MSFQQQATLILAASGVSGVIVAAGVGMLDNTFDYHLVEADQLNNDLTVIFTAAGYSDADVEKMVADWINDFTEPVANDNYRVDDGYYDVAFLSTVEVPEEEQILDSVGLGD